MRALRHLFVAPCPDASAVQGLRLPASDGCSQKPSTHTTQNVTQHRCMALPHIMRIESPLSLLSVPRKRQRWMQFAGR